jgi:hypothetical protein
VEPRRETKDKSTSEAVWLSWYMCAVSLALAVGGLLLLVLSREARPQVPVFAQWAEDAVIAVGFSALGAVVAPRFPPKNPIGWLFCSLGLVAAVLLFGGEYAYYSLVALPGSLPGGEGFAWVVCWLWVVHWCDQASLVLGRTAILREREQDCAGGRHEAL